MWKDDYVSGMQKLSPGEDWRADTLRRMESARKTRRIVPLKKAAAFTACAAALLLAVATIWPSIGLQNASGGTQSIAAAAAAPEEMQARMYSAQDAVAADENLDAAPLICGTVVRWTQEELVLSVDGAEQTFRLDEQTVLEEGVLQEGALVQVNGEQQEDGTVYASRVTKAQG